jgi:cell division septation protein DedD
MDENNKLFVFEKKEVILIFLFIVVIAVISFTLGVRVGKGLSLKEDSYTGQDLSTINLKSMDEEYVESVVDSKKKESNFESSMNDSAPVMEDVDEGVQGDMEQRLREEMEKLAEKEIIIEKPVKKVQKKMEVKKVDKTNLKKEDMYNQQNDFSGKYTIQLYSNKSKEVAQDFADGFIAKGYDVIVNEAAIPGKGVWYRVSIGVFGNMNEAKDYLDKEKAIFQDSKYLIQQF